MDLHLKDRVAVVAAGSLGLGFATALQLAREGALVALCSRNEAHVSAATDAIQAETGRAALGVVADVTVPKDIDHFFERVIEEHGGLDVLVTNAGGPPSGGFEDVDDSDWLLTFDLNLMSTVRLIRAAVPHLRVSPVPAVLTISSVAVKQPIEKLVLSNTLRPAVAGLTKDLALELGRDGIRVNSILPGWIETARVHDLMEARASRNGTTFDEEIVSQMANAALGRMATPEEFAMVATFLCSPAASYLTGIMLTVDGGLYKGTL